MVEHLLAKEKVAGSNPVFRSSVTRAMARVFSCTRIESTQYALGRESCQRGRGGMADAAVLKTAEGQPSCGFESRRPHRQRVLFHCGIRISYFRIALFRSLLQSSSKI